jgi:tetratricopeptide (TPR) repeat protein/curved DNA-binding protein CbpA
LEKLPKRFNDYKILLEKKKMEFPESLTTSEFLKEEGNKLYKEKKYKQANEAYEEALEIEFSRRKPNEILISKLYFNISQIMIIFNKNEEALSKLTKSLDYNNKYINAYKKRSKLLYSVDRFDESINDLKKILEHDPNNEAVKIEIIEISEKNEEKKKKEHELKVSRMEELKEEGNILFKERKWTDALKKYDESIEILPMNKKVVSILHVNKSTIYLKIKEYEKSLEQCNKAIESDKRSVKGYKNRIVSYYELKKYDEAIIDLKMLSTLDKELSEEIKKISKAIEEVKKINKKSHYEILGVKSTETSEEIKKVYKKIKVKNHPDKFVDEKEKSDQEVIFKELGEAYDVLIDDKKRKEYDKEMEKIRKLKKEKNDYENIFKSFYVKKNMNKNEFSNNNEKFKNQNKNENSKKFFNEYQKSFFSEKGFFEFEEKEKDFYKNDQEEKEFFKNEQENNFKKRQFENNFEKNDHYNNLNHFKNFNFKKNDFDFKNGFGNDKNNKGFGFGNDKKDFDFNKIDNNFGNEK